MDQGSSYNSQQSHYAYGNDNDNAAGSSSSSSTRGHGHSLSLGQMPLSSAYAYDHHHQQQYGSGSHSRSYSASAAPPLHSPYLSAANAQHNATTSSSNGGDSNPTSRLQTISPLMGHPHQALPNTNNNASNLGQSLQYSSGLGLAGVPIPPSPGGAPSQQASSSSLSTSNSNNPIYAPMPSYMHHHHHSQSLHYTPSHHHQHLHGHVTPPSPSTAHASSIRHSHSHSMSDSSTSFPYTPQSYTSNASSLPSSYHPAIGSNSNGNKYDPHSTSLPSILPHQHSHHQAYPPYPLATSNQGFMTVYTASPTYGSKDSQINLQVGVAPHDPHHIRGFRVLFGSHGTTTRVVGESRADGEERVELVAVVPPIHLTNRIPTNGSTCQLSLQALDEGGNVADWAELGVFEFTGKTLIR